MKTFKRYIMLGLMFAIASIGLQSCLFEEDDNFEQSAATRLTEDVNNYMELLQSAPNGWLMEYYIGPDYALGGIPVLCRFTKDKVEMATTLPFGGSVPGQKYSSLYTVKSEKSTSLSFDTYNPIIHYLASPGIADEYNPNATYGGDYEFVLRSGDKDKIVLEGKKYANTMVLTRLGDDVNWAEYIKKANVVSDQAFRDVYNLVVDGKVVGQFKRFNWVLTYTPSTGGESVEMPFFYTDEGLKLRVPIQVDGMEAVNFRWNVRTMTFNCSDAGAEKVSIVSSFPEGARLYYDFEGTYKLTATKPYFNWDTYETERWDDPVSLTVRIEADSINYSYNMVEVNPAESPDDANFLHKPIPVFYGQEDGQLYIMPTPLAYDYDWDYYPMALCLVYPGTWDGEYVEFSAADIRAEAFLKGNITSESPFTLTFKGMAKVVDEYTGEEHIVPSYGFALMSYEDDSYESTMGHRRWFNHVKLERIDKE